MGYDTAVIRQLIISAFNDDELNDLAFDHFPAVYREGEKRPFSEKARLLVDYCQRHGVIDRLLRVVRERNPAQYRQFIGQTVRFNDRAQYLAQVARQHETLEFVGIPELKDRHALNVEDVFIHLQAEVESPALPAAEDGLLPDTGPLRRRVAVTDALAQHRQLVILGDPGAGKTTLLKYITLSFAREEGARLGVAEVHLPIFVRLYDYVARRAERQADYSLIDYLYTQARESLMLTLEPGFFEQELTQGRCVVCLDGMDELGRVGVRREVAQAIVALSHRYPGNRFIVTSRIVGYNEAPLDGRTFIHHRILPFGEDDIDQFVHKWYLAREQDAAVARRQAHQLTATIMDAPRIKTLAANPLLLTIITLIHRVEAELPHERVKLYEKCVTALVETWEQVKRLPVTDRERPYYEHRYRLLEQLAFWLHQQPGGNGRPHQIAEGDLTVQLSQFLLDDPFLQLDRRVAWAEAEAFISLIKARTGLLVERGDGIYTFAHLTFQEYLAAVYLMHEYAHSIDNLWIRIQPRLHDPHWRELILLLLGSLNKFKRHPTALVRRILAQEDQYEPVLHRHLFLAADALADRVLLDARLRNEIIDRLLTLLETDWLAREEVIAALGRMRGQPRLTGQLLTLVHEAETPPLVRRDGARALYRLGQEADALAVLRQMAADANLSAAERQAAATTLAELGMAVDAVQYLLALAHQAAGSVSTRSAATLALGQLGVADESVLAGLLALTRDETADAEVRSAAMVALGELGAADTAVCRQLLAFVQNPVADDWIRSAAAAALAELGPLEPAMLIGLADVARDEAVADSVRRNAAAALAELGDQETAAPVLMAMAQKPMATPMLRLDAAAALAQFGVASAAVPVLLDLAAAPTSPAEVRCEALEALAQLGLGDEAILAELRALIAAGIEDPEVRSTAALALSALGDGETAVPLLWRLARDEATPLPVRVKTAVALADLESEIDEAAAMMQALLRDEAPPPYLRLDLARALGKVGGQETAVATLMALLEAEKMPMWARRAAYDALKSVAS